MSGLFALLFFTSLVALILGLIKPRIISRLLRKDLSRRKIGLLFGILTIAFLILASLTTDTISTTKPKIENTQTSTPQPKQQIVKEKQQIIPKYVFDVPSLVGKNIDEVKAVLGSPADKEPTQQQMSLGIDEWSLTFKKDGKELLVTYNPKTKKIIDFFISTDDPSGKTKDRNHLMELGNLKETDPKYKLEFVKAIKDSSTYTGVKVIPK